MLASDKCDFGRIQFMVVDNNHHSLSIATAVVSGFGAHNILKCTTLDEAREQITGHAVDFLLVGGHMDDGDAYGFVRWLRRKGPEINRFIPIIALSGHTRRSQVLEARDCGVQAVIAKPLVPKILLERAFWLARDKRHFIECDEYVGPDRRLHDLGPPEGVPGRRGEDAPGALEAETENDQREPQTPGG